MPGESARLWKQLKQVLVQCHNLRALSLDTHPYANTTKTLQIIRPSLPMPEPRATHDLPPTNKVRLPLEPGDKLPTLNEFELRAKSYDLSAAHCKQMLECMDFTKLKRLRIGPSFSMRFFELFASKLPQLEELDFAYRSPKILELEELHFAYPQPHQYPPLIVGDASQPAVCAELLRSVRKLKILTVRYGTINIRDCLWRNLAKQHGHHLQRLSIQSSHGGIEVPYSEGDLSPLLSNFSVLNTLDLSFRIVHPSSRYCDFCPSIAHAPVSLQHPDALLRLTQHD
jgi:hypothetical protein